MFVFVLVFKNECAKYIFWNENTFTRIAKISFVSIFSTLICHAFFHKVFLASLWNSLTFICEDVASFSEDNISDEIKKRNSHN